MAKKYKTKSSEKILSKIKKTNKFITAVLYGVPIVSFKWIEDSIKTQDSNCKPIEKYILSKGWNNNPKLKLFKNMNFIVSQSLNYDPSLKNIDLKDHIISMRGTVHRTVRAAIQNLDKKDKNSVVYEITNKAPRNSKLPKSLE